MKHIFSTLILLTLAFPILAQPLAGAAKIDQLLMAADSARATEALVEVLTQSHD